MRACGGLAAMATACVVVGNDARLFLTLCVRTALGAFAGCECAHAQPAHARCARVWVYYFQNVIYAATSPDWRYANETSTLARERKRDSQCTAASPHPTNTRDVRAASSDDGDRSQTVWSGSRMVCAHQQQQRCVTRPGL